jgi:hypothetical protein
MRTDDPNQQRKLRYEGMKILGLKGTSENDFSTIEMIGSLWNFRSRKNKFTRG